MNVDADSLGRVLILALRDVALIHEFRIAVSDDSEVMIDRRLQDPRKLIGSYSVSVRRYFLFWIENIAVLR